MKGLRHERGLGLSKMKFKSPISVCYLQLESQGDSELLHPLEIRIGNLNLTHLSWPFECQMQLNSHA